MEIPDPPLKTPLYPKLDYYQKPPKDPNSKKTRIGWLALFFSCLVNFGSYFCYDNPQALQTSLYQTMNLDDIKFNALYSVYSFPNIILPFFGGYIIDRIGVRIGLISLSALLIIGQGIVTYGVSAKNFPLMVIGRAIFGLGGETLTVAQSAITAKYFIGKEIAFAMGMTISVARLGSSLNSLLSPRLFEWTGKLYMPFLLGGALCVFSCLMGLILCFLDKRTETKELQFLNPLNKIEIVHLKDLKQFNKLFYLLVANCFFIYGAFFALNNNLNKIMVTRFGFSQVNAGNYIPIVYVAAALITPLFGLLTDYYGRKVLLMLLSSLVFLACHLVMAFLSDTTDEGRVNYGIIGVLVGIGLFYASYAAVFWPCVALVVKRIVIGTSYGIITSFQNLVLTGLPFAVAAVQTKTEDFHGGYFWTEIMLAGIVGVGVLITLWMFVEDRRKAGVLNKPSEKEWTTVEGGGSEDSQV